MTAQLISIGDARALVAAAVRPLPSEQVEIASALGRVLAEDVAADGDRPPFASSAMDGFAIASGPARELPVVGESRAGHPAAHPLGDGEAMRISTGAAVPAGADAVVPIERAEILDGSVRVPETANGANVRAAGEDISAGDVVLRAGCTLGPAELAVAASLGLPRLACGARPRVAILVTGDELVAPGAPTRAGEIYDSNSVALAALAQRAGALVVATRTVRDTPEATSAAIADALEAADVVCISGGVSVGPHDHVKPALAALGVDERFWGVRLKPGKPTWFGARGETLVFGLPGNPVSAMVTFHLFARLALRRLQGSDARERRLTARLERPVSLNPEREQALRCALSAGADGWRATPFEHQASHIITSMLGADALALVPAGEGSLPAGAAVDMELLAGG